MIADAGPNEGEIVPVTDIVEYVYTPLDPNKKKVTIYC